MHPRARARLATGSVLVLGALLAVVASRPGSPFTPPLFDGARAPAWLRVPAELLGLDSMSREVVAVVGGAVIFALVAAFLFALRGAWRGDVAVRTVVLVAVALHLLALAMPLFLSRDVYSYAIYGRMVSEHGANPYVQVPAAFPDDPVYPLVSVDWIDSRSVYGPAFSAVAAGVTAVTSSPGSAVLGFKLLAAMGSLATMLVVIPAARRALPCRVAFAAMLVGWNPVMVFHSVAGGHNDTLLALGAACGTLALLARREALSTAALSLGTLVKVSGGVPLLMAMVAEVIRRPGRRLRTAAAHAGIAVAVALPFVVPFLQARDPTLGTLELATRQGWLAPSRFVLTTLRSLARALGGDPAGDAVSIVVRAAFPLLFVWVLYALVRHLAADPARLEPRIVVAAMGWASLVSLLVSPVLLPWYAAWVLPLAWILPRPARGAAVVLSMALAITELVAEPSRSPGVYEAMVFGLHWVATPVVLLVLVRLVMELRRRVRAGPGVGLDDPLLVEGGGLLGTPEAQRVPGAGQEHDGDDRAGAPGEHAQALGGRGGEDGHPHPG